MFVCGPLPVLSGTSPGWDQEGRDWPNRDASRFVRAAGFTWHVQIMGAGPVVLLVHGTGAATHSWRELAPMLAERFTVVATDLPGHGINDKPSSYRLSLPGMTSSMAELLETLGVEPTIGIGHSAGAAILIRMALDARIRPETIVSLNGAILPLRGMPGPMFSSVAKLLAINPVVPQLFAWRAGNQDSVAKLIGNTGSEIEPAGIEFYRRLVATPRHVAGALAMMANWDLDSIASEMARLEPELILVAAEKDRAIPPATADKAAAIAPRARVIHLPDLGHLAHEEAPEQIARLIFETVGARTDAA
ncbi:MAG: alpha/beta fold hydrolase BchO [Geminicoccaceae bacterium]